MSILCQIFTHFGAKTCHGNFSEMVGGSIYASSEKGDESCCDCIVKCGMNGGNRVSADQLIQKGRTVAQVQKFSGAVSIIAELA